MSFSDAELIALVEAGVTAAQLAAAIIAGRADRRARRLAQLAGVKPDSVAPVAASSPILSPQQSPVFEPREAQATGKGAARLGLLMAAALRPAARRVAAALIGRSNLETGRCDPGLQRLSEETGLQLRSVRRALAELDAAGLVRRQINRGRNHTNAYAIDFERLAALTKPDSETQNRTPGAGKPDRRVLQNLKEIIPTSEVERSSRRAKPTDHRQRELLLPIAGGQAPRVDIDAQADIRLVLALDRHLARFGPRFAEQTRRDLDDVAWAAARRAELHQRGTGLAVLLAALAPQEATGPPPAVATG